MTALTIAGDTGMLVDEYRLARDRLDRGVDLLVRGIDLRELLTFGIDIEIASHEVADFRRACLAHKREGKQ